jgi:hypothetical protein
MDTTAANTVTRIAVRTATLGQPAHAPVFISYGGKYARQTKEQVYEMIWQCAAMGDTIEML